MQDLTPLNDFRINQVTVSGEISQHDVFGPSARVFCRVSSEAGVTGTLEALVAISPREARVAWLSFAATDDTSLRWPERYGARVDESTEVPPEVERFKLQMLCQLALRSVPAMQRAVTA